MKDKADKDKKRRHLSLPLTKCLLFFSFFLYLLFRVPLCRSLFLPLRVRVCKCVCVCVCISPDLHGKLYEPQTRLSEKSTSLTSTTFALHFLWFNGCLYTR
jgi:hypothetical protein